MFAALAISKKFRFAPHPFAAGALKVFSKRLSFGFMCSILVPESDLSKQPAGDTSR